MFGSLELSLYPGAQIQYQGSNLQHWMVLGTVEVYFQQLILVFAPNFQCYPFLELKEVMVYSRLISLLR